MSIREVIVDKFGIAREVSEVKENEMIKGFNAEEVIAKYSYREQIEIMNTLIEKFANEVEEESVAVCTMVLNKELDGIELTFSDKPTDEIREMLKANNFRWHSVRKIWYAKNTDGTMEFAKGLCA